MQLPHFVFMCCINLDGRPSDMLPNFKLWAELCPDMMLITQKLKNLSDVKYYLKTIKGRDLSGVRAWYIGWPLACQRSGRLRSMTNCIKHGLPEDSCGYDFSWFDRLNDFEQAETRRQVKYKRESLQTKEDGPWSKNRNLLYPHILPDKYAEKNFYLGLYEQLKDYLLSEKIAVHTEIQNMRSSQACCWNFLFPIRQNLNAAHIALKQVLPGVSRVTAIEFEYTGRLDVTAWLGEPPGGKRGQNRTSADAAIWWVDENDKPHITLIEWKYTEKEFGTCGGYQSEDNNHKDKCRTLDVQKFNQRSDCYLATWKNARTKRKYWDHLRESGIDLSMYLVSSGCPFEGPFYQLMRLHLLGEYIAQEEKRDFSLVVICFKQNKELIKLHGVGATTTVDVISAWKELLCTPQKIALSYIDDVAVDFQRAGLDNDWLAYLADRYGVKVD